MIKGSFYWDDIVILNICVLNNRASKYTTQNLIELQGKIDRSKVIVGNLKHSFSVIDRK